MILKIRQLGDPVLRQRARPLSVEEIRSDPIQQLIKMMVETLNDEGGVGLAAPQIGQSLQLAIVEDTEERMRHLSEDERKERGREPIPLHVMINPRLTVEQGVECEYFEGCLSMAGYQALVRRALKVRVECLDEHGDARDFAARDWHARILQHEIDHLNGVIYVDRDMESRTLTNKNNFDRHWKGKRTEDVRRALDVTFAPDTERVGRRESERWWRVGGARTILEKLEEQVRSGRQLTVAEIRDALREYEKSLGL